MAWYPAFGFLVFWSGLGIAILMYALKRKWYPVMYLASVALYIFTMGFNIDAFNVSKDGILILLAISTVVMIGAGSYLANKFRNGKDEL